MGRLEGGKKWLPILQMTLQGPETELSCAQATGSTVSKGWNLGQENSHSKVGPSDSIFGPTISVSKTLEVSKHLLKPVEVLFWVLGLDQIV